MSKLNYSANCML